jgi:hypothetical protein
LKILTANVVLIAGVRLALLDRKVDGVPVLGEGMHALLTFYFLSDSFFFTSPIVFLFFGHSNK